MLTEIDGVVYPTSLVTFDKNGKPVAPKPESGPVEEGADALVEPADLEADPDVDAALAKKKAKKK